MFIPILGKMTPFRQAYFSDGLVQPPTSCVWPVFVSIENPRRNFRLNLGSQEPRGGRFGHRSLSAEEAGETNCANALKGMVCRPKSTHPKTNIASSRRPSQKEITSSNPSDSGAGLVSGSVHPWKSKHHYKIGFHRRPFV